MLARWGGMGTHRYQVGFSGDVQGLTWPNLAYQPYFTLTSANVGYMYWSHDIEMPAADYEMGARWVQWAAVSPVFRSHERGMSGGGCADTLVELTPGIQYSVWVQAVLRTPATADACTSRPTPARAEDGGSRITALERRLCCTWRRTTAVARLHEYVRSELAAAPNVHTAVLVLE